MAADDLDAIFHLGDYIYEGGISKKAIRPHNSDEIVSLEDYRNRYALYRSDADLQAAHASCPWVVTWDDHEVENDYVSDIPQDVIDAPTFLARRAAAYQAYYEHMPLRRACLPKGPMMQLYRGVRYGQLVDFSVLDTRQYRSDQPCGKSASAPCDNPPSTARV
jgi:alkaline phosphatase D